MLRADRRRQVDSRVTEHARWAAQKELERRIKSTRNIKPAEVVPYTPAEILGACEKIGRNSYERRRAQGMIRLLRDKALRVSDVATLARDRVQGGRIMLRTPISFLERHHV